MHFWLAIAIAIHLAEIFPRAHRLSTWPVLVLTELSANFQVNSWSVYAGVVLARTPSRCGKPATPAHPAAVAGRDPPGAAAGEGS